MRLTRENTPMSTGVVRAMALSTHCRWVSTPRWARASSKVTSTCQRWTNHPKIASGAASRSVPNSACGSNFPWGSRTRTQRIGTTGFPAWYHTAIPLVISTVRSVWPYHRGSVIRAVQRSPIRASCCFQTIAYADAAADVSCCHSRSPSPPRPVVRLGTLAVVQHSGNLVGCQVLPQDPAVHPGPATATERPGWATLEAGPGSHGDPLHLARLESGRRGSGLSSPRSGVGRIAHGTDGHRDRWQNPARQL